MAVDLQTLLDKVGKYLPPERQSLIRESYLFASRCHEGQLRLSGGPYLEHPTEAALMLADLQMDATTLAAALLHDVAEDSGVTLEELEQRFGPEVRKLVDGVTKLTKIEAQAAQGQVSKKGTHKTDLQAESLRKMLVAMAEDIRVVLIKFADRLHNLLTLDALSPDRQAQMARETLEVYAPLAHRLGTWDFKWRLEDLAFRYLEPEKYREISRLIATKRREREDYVSRLIQTLERELKQLGLQADCQGRAKHIYSIYKKVQKYAEQGKEFHEIYDLFAVRILVADVADCYRVLGVIHSLWHPIPGQFDDYIANPKENLYQTLHTTVLGPEAFPLEVQIRTHEMHRVAEYGVAAHWAYKEGTSSGGKFEERMTWLRQLLEWQREVAGTEEFLDSVRTDLFQDQVFVYTPKGDILELPQGSTPIDFAFRIHTELGYKCVGAKVNGRMLPFDYQLKSGDTVEVLTSRVSRGPSLDWLNPDIGYVRTAQAREKIRQWFRRQERGDNIQRGKALLDKEMRRLGLDLDEADLAKAFHYSRVDDLLAALGSGQLSTYQLEARLLPQEQVPKVQMATPKLTPIEGGDTSQVQVLGVNNLLTRVARCCQPIPGDDVLGFITRSQGITIHRRDCYNIVREKEEERIVSVEWGPSAQAFPLQICIEAWDRVGLLRDLTTVVAEGKVNIAGASTVEHPDDTTSVYLNLQITNISQLSRLFAKLESVKGVLSIQRVTQT